MIYFMSILTGKVPRSTNIRLSVLSRVTSGVFKASKDAPIFWRLEHLHLGSFFPKQ